MEGRIVGSCAFRLFLGLMLACVVCLLTTTMLLSDDSPTAPTEPEIEANSTWVQHREVLLSAGGPLKVVLFCYMRGGSSLAGQIFNTDPAAILYYEPLASFYSAWYGLRYASKPQDIFYSDNLTMLTYVHEDAQEKALLTDHLDHLLTCQYDKMAPQAWLHPFMRNSQTLSNMTWCIRRTSRNDPLRKRCADVRDACSTVEVAIWRRCPEMLRLARRLVRENVTDPELRGQLEQHGRSLGVTNMFRVLVSKVQEQTVCSEQLARENQHCMRIGMQSCQATKLRVAEVLRMRMSSVRSVLERIPSAYLVHYTRDPRAIALSRVNTASLMIYPDKRDVTLEAAVLCDQMRRDIAQRRELEMRFPSTVIQIRYEDLVLEPVTTVRNLYRQLGYKFPDTSGWEQYASQALEGANVEDRQFGTSRRNGTESVYRWREKIAPADLHTIRQHCGDVIRALGYPDD